ncbi:MAG TPA: hypothetical protein VGA65_02300 [Hyphomicrobium sp.]
MRIRLARLVAAAAVLLSGLGTSLQAATLENIQAEVLIDRGGGFDITAGPTLLNPGDTVIANPGGGAVIVYNSECKVPVKPGAAVAVHKDSPCSSGGGGVFNTTTLLIGGTVVGLGAGAAVLLTAGDDEKPVSP